MANEQTISEIITSSETPEVIQNGSANGHVVSREEYLRQKKKETLDKLDNAKFSCFHVRACIVSGIGFFTV